MGITKYDSDIQFSGSVQFTAGFRAVAEDGALVLAPADKTVHLLSSTTGTKAATMTAGVVGQRVRVLLVARSGGSYTLAASGVTVTLDATREGVDLVYDGAAWQYDQLLGGATVA